MLDTSEGTGTKALQLMLMGIGLIVLAWGLLRRRQKSNNLHECRKPSFDESAAFSKSVLLC